jgi:hypothetical protein
VGIELVALDAAVAEVHQPARVGGHVRFVGDHQHGDAVLGVERPEQFHDLVAACRIEVAGGLVGQQHGGLGDDRAGNGDTLLLPAGELGRRVVLPAGQADLGQRGAGGGVALRGALAAVEQRQLDVLLRRGARQQVEALEDEAQVAPPQPGALVARQALHLDTLEGVAARRRHVQAAEQVHHGGLARAARAHHGDELARRDLQIDALEGLEGGLAAAEGLGDAAQADQLRPGRERGLTHLGAPVEPLACSVTMAMPSRSAAPLTSVRRPLLRPAVTSTDMGRPS